MKRFGILIFLVSVAVGLLYAGGGQEVVPESDEDGFMSIVNEDVQLRWKVTGETIDFEMTAATTGWVSIGFNPTRVMKDADFIFGFVKDGEVVISDQFGTGAFSHASDEELGGEDNIISFSGSESDGKTSLNFTIPVNSGDEYDSVLTPGQTHTVLYAFGPDGADNFEKKHSNRGKVDVEF